MLYIRKNFKDSVDNFEVYFDIRELKYAYDKLGFYKFVLFLIYYFSMPPVIVSKETAKHGFKKGKRKEKKENKAKRRLIQKHLLEKVVQKDPEKVVEDRVKKSAKKLKAKLMIEVKEKKEQSEVRLLKSIVKKKNNPARERRKLKRAEKFGVSFLKLFFRTVRVPASLDIVYSEMEMLIAQDGNKIRRSVRDLMKNIHLFQDEGEIKLLFKTEKAREKISFMIKKYTKDYWEGVEREKIRVDGK